MRMSEFFQSLRSTPGIDAGVADVVLKVWNSGDFNRDSLLAALQKYREKDNKSASPAN